MADSVFVDKNQIPLMGVVSRREQHDLLHAITETILIGQFSTDRVKLDDDKTMSAVRSHAHNGRKRWVGRMNRGTKDVELVN